MKVKNRNSYTFTFAELVEFSQRIAALAPRHMDCPNYTISGLVRHVLSENLTDDLSVYREEYREP